LKSGGFLFFWNAHCPHNVAIEAWQFKSRHLRKHLRGWNSNEEATIKKKKKQLIEEFDILDIFSEKNMLSTAEKE
jgi:hypothetical protein